MLSVDKFKQSLGKAANTMTEEQILVLRDVEDQIAEAICNMLMLPKIQDNSAKNQVEIKPEL